MTKHDIFKSYKMKELKKAQKILQRAHDYIEMAGFDIDFYQPEMTPFMGEDIIIGRNKKLVDHGPCCYIGATRLVAGVRPNPSNGTDSEDGPELTLALRALDATCCEVRTDETEPGRVIEAEGLEDHHKKDEALLTYRSALTAVYNEIESRKRK